MTSTALIKSRWTSLTVWIACLLPAALLYWRWKHDELGFNFLETLQRTTGDWTLRFLLFSLCITPLRKLPGLSALITYRRRLGLFAFFYGCLHFSIYLHLDKQWDWAIIWEDFTVRRFYVMGFLALFLLIPLALTSTKSSIRRLGKNWQRLHRLVYLSVAAGIIHYTWQGKTLVIGPIIYAACFAILMLFRGAAWWTKRQSVRHVRTPIATG